MILRNKKGRVSVFPLSCFNWINKQTGLCKIIQRKYFGSMMKLNC